MAAHFGPAIPAGPYPENLQDSARGNDLLQSFAYLEEAILGNQGHCRMPLIKSQVSQFKGSA